MLEIEKLTDFENTLKLSINWIRSSSNEQIANNFGLLKQFKNSYYRTRRFKNILNQRTSVGIFGASQSGKSYFVSSLAKSSSGKIFVSIDNKDVNFLELINPPGGKESTAIVTRFTNKKITTPVNFPIKIKLLNEFDLIKILVNSYFNDFELDPIDDLAELTQKIQAKIDVIDFREIENDEYLEKAFFLEDYCERRFKDEPYYLALKKTNFWTKLNSIGNSTKLRENLGLLQLLWGENRSLTELFEFLWKEIAKFGSAEYAYCPLIVLFKNENGTFIRSPSSIINVSALHDVLDPRAEVIAVLTDTNEKVNVSIPVLSALAAEIIFSLSGGVHDFFNYGDLLDFPGARSRHKRRQDTSNDLAVGSFENFLRGKISFLFENYSANFELASLLLCIGPGPQEVVGLNRTIEDWVEGNYGLRPDSRDNQPDSFFLILTKLDEEFKISQGAGVSSLRWDTRLIASLEEPFGFSRSKRTDWLENWNSQGCFKNTFWFRSPDADSPHLIRKELGSNNNLVEVGIEPSRIELISKILQAYSESDKVNRYLSSQQDKLESALKINDGGASFILEKLTDICRSNFRIKQMSNLFYNEIKMRHLDLKRFFISDNIDEQVLVKRKLAKDVTEEIGKIYKKQKLGEFIIMLTIKEDTVRDIFSKTFEEINLKSYSVQNEHSAPYAGSLNNEDLVSLGLVSDVQEETVEEVRQLDTDFSKSFVLNLIEQWKQDIKMLFLDKSFTHYFSISQDILYELLNEIEIFAFESGLCSSIRSMIDNDQFVSSKWNLELRKSSLIAAEFNSFITTAGMELRKSKEIELLNGQISKIFNPTEEISEVHLSENISDFDKQYSLDWIRGIQYLVRSNIFGKLKDEAMRLHNLTLAGILSQFEQISRI